MLQSKIKDEDRIIVHFHPWHSNTPEAIIEDFFQVLQDNIRPYYSSLARKLLYYSQRLVKINENVVTTSFQFATSTLSGIEPLKGIQDEINEAFQKINKQIVVVIDDVDRLDSGEIAEVLKLIRNTANFYNTLFIVAYDRDYLVNALRSNQVHKPQVFLEKIFQLEINLPRFDKVILRRKLYEYVRKIIKKETDEKLEKAIFGGGVVKQYYLDDFLCSMRDVVRLSNSISVNYAKLQGEVYFSDFLKLEVLRLKFPYVYNLLATRKDDVLDTDRNKAEFILREIEISKQTNTSAAVKKIWIERHLEESGMENGVEKMDVERIMILLKKVFPGGVFPGLVSEKDIFSVLHTDCYYRYFEYNLLKGDLSQVVFDEARATMPLEEFQKKMDGWIEEGLFEALADKFINIKSYSSKEDFEKVISAIFYIANKEVKNNQYAAIQGFPAENLSNKLYDGQNTITLRFYKNTGGKAEFKKFVKELLVSAKFPYHYEADFISYIVDGYHSEGSFILSKEELNKIAIDYLQNYCDKTDKWGNYIFRLYNACRLVDWSTRYKQESNSATAKKILIDFITNKDFAGFVDSIVREDSMNRDKYMIGDFPLSLFGHWQAFEEYINGLDDGKYPCLKEFKDLFSKFKKVDFKKYVSFTPKEIHKGWEKSTLVQNHIMTIGAED